MKRVGAAALLILTACGSAPLARHTPTSTTPTTATSPQPLPGGQRCHLRPGPLPDPVCTPGATNPVVTQATIGVTICRSGWTATIRPPVSYTNALKRQQQAAYGEPIGSQGEEDHLIPLELGGAPSNPLNLWPQPGPIPNPKDSVENNLRRAVCAGTVTLAAAQAAIAADWTTAEKGHA